MKIHVGRKQLREAFFRHRHVGSPCANDSHLLLLIYAVECGLKELLLEQRGAYSTEKLDKDDLSHDLDELLKTVGARERFGHCTLTSPATASLSPGGVHQALRYGARLETKSRASVEQRAKSVIAWLEENIT
jgi:hypothetical protein